MNTQEIIQRGMSLVQSDPACNLEIGFRCSLLSSLDQTTDGNGRRRRTELAILVVEKVLPLWQSFLPTDHTPYQALDLAKKLLAGAISSASVETEIGQLWAHCDDLSWKCPDKQNVIVVGYAAIQAVREASSEKHFGCNQINESSVDTDVDPYDHDSSFCAAIAYSGGPPWEKNSDTKKRLEFWVWWLSSVGRVAVTSM